MACPPHTLFMMSFHILAVARPTALLTRKKTASQSQAEKPFFAMQGMTDSNEENGIAGCSAAMGVISCKNVIKVV